MSSSYFGRDDDDDSVRYYDTDGNTATYRGPNALGRATRDNFGSRSGFLEQAGGLVNQVLRNAQKRDDRDAFIRALQGRAQPFGGRGMSGNTMSLADGSLTQVNPPSFEPIVFPGGGGGAVGGRSTGQRIAGAASGALSGFQAGAATGIPHLAGIGAIVGGIGSLFG